MNHKKLAVLLAAAVLVGQATQVSNLFAKAESQMASNTAFSIQVASVIQRPDIANPNDILKYGKDSATPDLYTINLGEGKLPTVIQALEQDEESASLFVNGSEIFRLQGELADMTAYQRVKVIADKLNSLLVTNSDSELNIEPAMLGKQAVVRVGDQVLATVDAQSVKTAQSTAAKLTFAWVNRFRQALGSQTLLTKDYPQFNETADENYVTTGRTQVGEASWYGPGFHGRRTASGTRYDMYGKTAAHRTLPFGTLVRVTNQRNQKSCVVKITDRGPYAHGRIIDLSKGAAGAIGMSGVAPVKLEIVQHIATN